MFDDLTEHKFKPIMLLVEYIWNELYCNIAVPVEVVK